MASLSAFRDQPKLLVVCGVRPQYIKAAALEYELRRWEEAEGRYVPRVFFDTGQHYSHALSSDLISELNLRLDRRLRHRWVRDPTAIIGSSVCRLSRYVHDRPSIKSVVVFGDANPALVGCLVAVKRSIALVHVEAGARRDPSEQEDFNSRVVDMRSRLRLCVTERAMKHLAQEGLEDGSLLTGDLAVGWLRAMVDRLGLEPLRTIPDDGGYVLVTLHRPANMNEETIQSLGGALLSHGRRVRWITHPRSHRLVQRVLRPAPIDIIPAVGFSNLLREISVARFILSDSGGVLREAHLLGKVVLIRRDVGGWPELVQAGFAMPIGGHMRDMLRALEWAEKSSGASLGSSPLVVPGGIRRGIEAIVRTTIEP
jgi:UDP-GlcNAc3NAcA epimerase